MKKHPIFEKKFPFSGLFTKFAVHFGVKALFFVSILQLARSLKNWVRGMVKLPGNTWKARDPEGITLWRTLKS